MDSNAKNFGPNRNAKGFLAFSPLEVRFLVDCSSCGNFTNAKVEHLWDTVFLRLDAALKMQPQQLYAAHAHVCE